MRLQAFFLCFICAKNVQKYQKMQKNAKKCKKNLHISKICCNFAPNLKNKPNVKPKKTTPK